LAEYAVESPAVCFFTAEPGGNILACNSTMAEVLKVPERELCGLPVWQFLTEPDAALLRERVASGTATPPSTMMLNFVSAAQIPRSLECMVQSRPECFAVIGSGFLREEGALQQGLHEINSELLVLAREHARHNKELESAQHALEKTLHEFSTLHWHFRKIGEVLPICMKCGKVEAGTARWEELSAFMLDHFPFLSHGYCPACAADLMGPESGSNIP
jgi:hypothetical protein